MIVVVETNFVLEWVLQQEHAEACEELLQLVERLPRLSLRIPAFAVAEAGMVLERRRGERQKFLREDLKRHVREIGRAKVLQRFDAALRALDFELATAEHDEASRWMEFRTTRLPRLEMIPLSSAMVDDTHTIQLAEIGQFPDALVFATVRLHLDQLRRDGVGTPVMFVSTDEAFGRQTIVQQLHKLGCTFVNNFENAVLRLRNSDF